MRDIFVLTIVIASVPFCFFRPFYGVLLWTVLAILNPHAQSWGIARTFPVALTVAIPTLAGAFCFERLGAALRTRLIGLLLLLWCWFTLTSLNASHTAGLAQHSPDTWYKWQFVSKVLLMAVLTAGVVHNWFRFRALLLAISGSFGYFILKAVPWMITTGGRFRLYGPPNTMIADNNDFGLALNMTLPLFFFMAKTETNKWMKRLFLLLFFISIPAIFATYSRGALVGFVAVLFMMLLRSPQRIFLFPMMVIATLVATFLAPEHWQQRMDFRQDGALIDASARSRFNSWTYSWNLALDHPIMGGGFEAFTPDLFVRYAPDPTDVHGPHSIYFGVLAEHGFVGLAIYFIVLASAFLTLWRIRRQARLYDDTSTLYYSAMLEFSLLAFMASGAFLGRAYFDYFFTVIACVAILHQLHNAAVESWEAEEAELVGATA